QVLSPNGGEKLTGGQGINIVVRSSGLTASRPVALINAGGPTAGSWLYHNYFTGQATPFSFNHAIDLSGVTTPAPADVYQTYAAGEVNSPLTFQLPVPDGTYTIRLHFVESFQAGTRLMDIRLNRTL